MTFRIASKRLVPATFAVPALLAMLAASSCGDTEDCVESQTCKDPPAQGGAAGEGGGTGGRSGGSSGSSGRGGNGVGGNANGGTGVGGGDAGTGGEGDAGGSDTGGSDAGGGGPGGAGQGGSGGAETDMTPPTVVSVSPAHGATGVTSDQNVVITFSEPMDTEATEAAYESADLPASAASATWNASGTVLTLDPTAPLAYATGTNPTSTTPRIYSISIGTGARDEAGNQLAQTYTFSFRTSRRITHTLRPVPLTTGAGYWAYWRTPEPLMDYGVCQNGAFVRVGAHPSPYNYTAVVAYDIAPLPAGIVDFESATVSATQAAGMGDPFARVGQMALRHIPPVPVNTGVVRMPLGGTALHDLGTFSNDLTPGPRMSNALVALEDDYASRDTRGNTSTYRLEFLSNQGGGPYEHVWVTFECASIVLTTTYVVP